MVRNYVPKKRFFEPTRIHKIAKDIMSDCQEDRQRALETFNYFKDLVSTNPEDDKAKAEMIHALGLSQDANDKIVKLLDMMIKMTQQEQRIEAAKKDSTESMSFEDLRKNG
jgi:hypothetical protein